MLVTTSGSPSTKLHAFSKEILLLFPTGTRLNCGIMTLPDLVLSATAAGLTDIVLLHENRGNPKALTISYLPHGPTAVFNLQNISTRQDLFNKFRIQESYPHIIFDGFSTPLGKRAQRILQHLFPARNGSKPGNRTITFKGIEGDCIEVRHHTFQKCGAGKVELAEMGPRMTMGLVNICDRTLDEEGDVQWQHNSWIANGREERLSLSGSFFCGIHRLFRAGKWLLESKLNKKIGVNGNPCLAEEWNRAPLEDRTREQLDKRAETGPGRA